jgi:hypothetical protein
MNASALRQITAHWGLLRATLAGLAGPAPTVHRAWRACVAATGAPVVAHLGDPEAPIPAPLAALYKAALGYSQVLTFLLLSEDGVADAPLAALGDPEEFVQWLEADRWLVGSPQVCAGSGAQIRELFEALRSGSGAPPPAGWPLDDAQIDAVCACAGLQVAWVIAAERDLARGRAPEARAGALHAEGTQAFLRAVRAAPGRREVHARRLFPAAAAPQLLEDFLARRGG